MPSCDSVGSVNCVGTLDFSVGNIHHRVVEWVGGNSENEENGFLKWFPKL